MQELTGKGFSVETRLAAGDPATELIRVAADEQVDLIAMSTHGHRFLVRRDARHHRRQGASPRQGAGVAVES